MSFARILAVFGICLSAASRSEALPLPLELFREAKPRTLQSQIPYELNPAVKRWIKFFTVKDRERFDRFMERGSLYKVLIQDILVENGVPPDMYYLAMIESGFARAARSHARAVGIWQFMPSTARDYGLRVDRDVDERLDVIRSTRAAARHLRELRREFGSWYLAMAAYNCGVGCVRKAVRRAGPRDFWTLARTRALPRETVNYIPKFQAAMTVARHPERFGFERKKAYHFPLVRRVRVKGQVPLGHIAREHRVPLETVIGLNLHLVRRRTPASTSSYEIWLPLKRPGA